MSTYNGSFTCIAVDMGAGSIRIMLGVIDKEGISYEEIHRITNEIVEQEGHERWDMEKMVREIRTGISRAIEISRNTTQSIGVDSWGVDFVLLDDRGSLVEMPVAYRDSRTEGMQELWETGMSAMETFSRTGINFYIFNTLYQLLSIRDSEKLERSSRILFLPCYINYLLTGEAKNELTVSSTSQMLGVEGTAWDERVLELLHLERQKLGDVILPGTTLGRVTLPEAEGVQLECVAVCGHDTACVVAALPVEDQNFAYISSGTWCIVGVESDRPLISEKAQHLGFTNERGYDNSYRTLKTIVGLWLLQGLKKSLPVETTYADMEQMTGEEVKSVNVIDPDDPSFYNPVEMKVAFDAYFHKTGQSLPESISGYIKCAYDSLCFSFRFYLEQLEQLSGRSIEVLHVVGGGSQSDYLNQQISTICGRKVISGPVEGATIGNVLIQAIAMGKVENLEVGRKLVKRSFPGKTYLPEKELSGTEDRYEKFLNLKTK